MRLRTSSTFLLIMFAASAFAQGNSAPDSLGGLAILQQVSRAYADAKSYRLESVEEITSSNDFQHNWQKAVLTAIEGSNNQYYYEGRSGTGGAIRVSDGTTMWDYHIDEHTYIKTISPTQSPQMNGLSEVALIAAENLRRSVAELASHYKSADRLPDATLEVNGKKISCYVVRLESGNLKRARPNQSSEETLWIDKAHMTILKSVEHAHTSMVALTGHIPMETEATSTYRVAELNNQMPASVFTFTPPADAKLIASFPVNNGGWVNLTGQTIPALHLKSVDGKQVSMESFRGKPVLLDVWATWCLPCVKSLPQLDALYRDTKDKGLVFLTLDTDEEVNTGSDLLAKRGYQWPNFHDDGAASDALRVNGIPRTLLIDGDGKVVFDKTDADEVELRTEIAKLGPEYASLAPKAEVVPCVVPK